jgi:hypothetical protein
MRRSSGRFLWRTREIGRITKRLARMGESVFVTSASLYRRKWKANRVFAVPPSLAAQLLVDQTHTLSIDKEIKAWKSSQARESKRLAAMESKRMARETRAANRRKAARRAAAGAS